VTFIRSIPGCIARHKGKNRDDSERNGRGPGATFRLPAHALIFSARSFDQQAFGITR